MKGKGEITMKQLQIGIQLHSVREDFEENPERTLKRVAEIGYQGVELVYSALTREAEFYADAIDAAGLKCYSVMMDWKDLQPDKLEKALAYCKKLPCDCAVLGSLHLAPLAGDPTYAGFLLDFVRDAAAQIRTAGFRTGFHNHDKDHWNRVPDGRTFFEYLFDSISEEFMLMIDTGNAQGGGADPIDLVKRYPHRTQIAHFKGYSAEMTYLTPVWASEIDSAALLDTLANEGDTEVLSVEFGRRGDYVPFERAERSYLWLADKLREKGLY